MDIKEQLQEIITLVENANFVKAHDELEELWRKYKNDETTREESFILKAFTNAVVVFELIKMNRQEHSKNVWNTYKKYEYLINEIDSINKEQYIKLKQLVYKYKEEYK